VAAQQERDGKPFAAVRYQPAHDEIERQPASRHDANSLHQAEAFNAWFVLGDVQQARSPRRKPGTRIAQQKGRTRHDSGDQQNEYDENPPHNSLAPIPRNVS
jgi:hypothetical protein